MKFVRTNRMLYLDVDLINQDQNYLNQSFAFKSVVGEYERNKRDRDPVVADIEVEKVAEAQESY